MLQCLDSLKDPIFGVKDVTDEMKEQIKAFYRAVDNLDSKIKVPALYRRRKEIEKALFKE